jgi:Pyruvate/2-oxoacid:ferredoxin oxidoreductase delta subunit
LITHVLICRCVRAHVVSPEAAAAAQSELGKTGVSCQVVDDVCELAAHQDAGLKSFAQRDGGLILACQPRALRWLMSAAGAPINPARTELRHLHSTDAAQCLQGLTLGSVTGGINPSAASLITAQSAETSEPQGATSTPAAWHAWYPVIDFDRCTHCLQCLSFCLFGVFGLSAEKRLQVENPEGCKPNCPACARVCPEAAIVFPKCSVAAMNGSDLPVTTSNSAPAKVNISALLGGNLYERLQERNRQCQARFSKDRDPQIALAERRQYLAELAKDIPPEVLNALPSMDEMRQRAAAAQARASIALNDRKPD